MCLDPDVLVAAGVKPRHIVRVLEVSRVTASNWLNGLARPSPGLTEKATRLMRAVAQATEDGQLPVPATLPSDERNVATLAILRRYYRDMK